MKNKILHQLEKALDFFTPLLILWQLLMAYLFVKNLSPIFFASFIVSPYLVPLLAYRLLRLFSPIEEGMSYIGQEGLSPWLAAFKIQLIFNSFLFLEKILILTGLYSLWLRAWGSKIGQNILWAQHTHVADRTSIEIGNNIFFGHQIFLSSHLVEVKNGKVFLYHKKIKIEDNCFIGAFTIIGPGVTVTSGCKLPAGTQIPINRTILPDDFKALNESNETIFFSRS